MLRQGSFTTAASFEASLLVPNVSDFTAQANGADVTLSWRNPEAVALQYVRVVRSHLGFPVHPNDGAIAYQGSGDSFTDVGILNRYSPVYYTAFVVTEEGLVSSGALALAFLPGEGALHSVPIPFVPSLRTRTEPGTFIPSAGPEASSSPSMLLPLLQDITVQQGEYRTSMADGAITLSAHVPVVVRIAAETVSRNVKTIIATIVDPSDHRQQFSFLLRLNADGTAYQAAVAPVAVVGTSALLVEIYDYSAAQVGRYRTPLTFTTAGSVTPLTTPVFPDRLIAHSWFLGPLILAPFLLALWLVWRVRHRDEDKR